MPDLHSPKLSYLATTALGRAYAALNKIDLATQTLKDAVEQIEAMRDQVAGQEESRQLFFEDKVSSYNSLIDLLIRQGKSLEALLSAERSKGRVLLDVIRSGRSDIARYMTASEKEEKQRLNRRISEMRSRINSEASVGSSLDSLYKQLDVARLDYQSFEDVLYVAHPDLRLRSGNTAPLTTDSITSMIASKSAYLEYVVGAKNIYAFVLSKKTASTGFELNVVTLPISPADLEKKVDLFHQRLAGRHPEFVVLARELYEALIEPVKRHLHGTNTICIIPDSFLWDLPFQAVMGRRNQYLIEDYALFYSQSLSVLREITKERVGAPRREASLIALGNPVVPEGEPHNGKICPLPEAEKEVRTVAKRYPSGAKVLIGPEASEESFKALAPTYSRIHIATHGVLDNRQPLYSYLLLMKTNDDPGNDGLLEAREIMNMDLHADLAVLSACETANGRISKGEGVVGMSWAFFVAGARSLLVTQWKVNSTSTSQLMAAFYKALESRNQARKASALKESVLQLMKKRQYRHPFYWAGFVMIGD